MAQLQHFAKVGKKAIATTTNYRQMLDILKIAKPEKPTLFIKPSSSYITEGQSIILPEGFKTVNQEIELGVVIEKPCKNIEEKDVMEHIGGYCIALDMTAVCQLTEAKAKGNPWLIGKGFDTSCPLSRFICKEEIPNPENVELWCSINGKLKQQGCTKDFIFSIPALVSYISKFITLEPCDVVLTGTPPGMTAVKDGDMIEGGIKNLVTIRFGVKEECN